MNRALAYVFVRYHSGDGAGHVGWGFELPDGRVCAGSVENHSGSLLTPPKEMGFWRECTYGFVDEFAKRSYDDARVLHARRADYLQAYRVTKWIDQSAYRAASRNCEDDVYDVLRAYGVEDLEAPFFNWFPRRWFSRLRGEKMTVPELRSLGPPRGGPEETDNAALERSSPLQPEWRKPFHRAYHRLNAAKLLRF